jgi:hypothetical protein
MPESIRQKHLDLARSDRWIDENVIGEFVDEHSALELFSGEAVDVYTPNGPLLLAPRPGTIRWSAIQYAWDDLLRAAQETTHRTVAAGGQEPFYSKMIGYKDGELTAITKSIGRGYRRIQTLLRNMAEVFALHRPKEYDLLRRVAKETPKVIIPGTEVFTSATINRWSPEHRTRMAVHRDDGNLPGALGVMTVIRVGKFKGGLTVWPKYRAAVELFNGDCLICDNQEAHGNTDVSADGDWERISVVGFYHDSNR